MVLEGITQILEILLGEEETLLIKLDLLPMITSVKPENSYRSDHSPVIFLVNLVILRKANDFVN